MPTDSTSPQSVGRRKMKVFISSAGKSRDVAAFVSAKLQQAGIEAYSDQSETPVGTEARHWLKSQIEDSDAVIMLITPNTVDSQWMQYELGLASGMDRLVVPIVVDVATDRLPEPIASRRVFRLDQVEQLIRQLRDDVSEQPAP